MASNSQAISDVLAEYKNTFQQFVDLEEILLCLKKKGIILNDEFHELHEETMEKRKKQTLFLLKIIPMRGDNAFPALLECLRERYEDLVKELETTLGEKIAASQKKRCKWKKIIFFLQKM